MGQFGFQGFLITATNYAEVRHVLQVCMDAKNGGGSGLDQMIKKFVTEYLVPIEKVD